MKHWLRTTLTILGMALSTHPLLAAKAPRVLDVRTQKADDSTYFHLRLELPNDLGLPGFDTRKPFSEADRRKFARLPRLVPADSKTRAVYYRYKPNQPSLNFYGKLVGEDTARFILLYPIKEAPRKEELSLSELLKSPAMTEVPLQVDFARAGKVAVPGSDPDDLHISSDDLRGHWAMYQAAHFAVLETQVLDFNFYSFAREATSRKYGVLAPAWVKRQHDPQHRLYEVTTGADAIAETLQLHRLLHPDSQDRSKRTIDIARVQGITVPEQPWQQLLAGKEPKLEPIAKLVPQDNYYVHFKNIRKFIDFGELLNQWGTNVTWAYEMRSRDYRLQERYEKQLCLKSTVLGKIIGPAVIKSLAVTGSDPYVREGTDITVIFHVHNLPALMTGLEGFLKEAREAHAGQLREGKEVYHNVTIESFITPFREVSLHRAVLAGKGAAPLPADDFVIYSNSPAGIRRIIDTHQGRCKSLAGAPDFQYMRTVFPLEDKQEEGFVFLSDAFVRRLVGPASRIKEKRRYEALTSMYMVMNAVLFTAWETGKVPADNAAALTGAGLKPDDVLVPEGKGITWDSKRQLVVADAYNTVHFTTPLIELPIDKITARERKDYVRFREEYTRLWSGYFDPIALRVSLDEKRIRVETHILPVANSNQYRLLAMTGAGKVPRGLMSGSVAKILFHVSRDEDWLTLQVDESALLRSMVELLIRWEGDPQLNLRREYEKLFWKLPLAVGLKKGPAAEKAEAEEIVKELQRSGLAEGKTNKQRYKNVTIMHAPISAKKYREGVKQLRETASQLEKMMNTTETPLSAILGLVPAQEAPAEVVLAVIDNTLYVGTNADFFKKLIDQAEAKKEGAENAGAFDANLRLSLAPDKARAAAGLLFEYEDHSLTLLNNQIWNCFYQTGILAPDAPAKARETTLRNFLGYVPVSASGAGYDFDPRLGEVVNRRHGSHRMPQLHAGVEDKSELGRFLNQLGPIRAELLFSDNTLRTMLTIERR